MCYNICRTAVRTGGTAPTGKDVNTVNRAFVDYIENSLRDIPYDDILYNFEKKTAEEAKKTERRVRKAGLNDEKIINDLLVSEHADIREKYGEYRRAELRSPDPLCNPYLAFALLIWAGLDGVERALGLPPAADVNLYTAEESLREGFASLPGTLDEARAAAAGSDFIAGCLPRSVLDSYLE